MHTIGLTIIEHLHPLTQGLASHGSPAARQVSIFVQKCDNRYFVLSLRFYQIKNQCLRFSITYNKIFTRKELHYCTTHRIMFYGLTQGICHDNATKRSQHNMTNISIFLCNFIQNTCSSSNKGLFIFVYSPAKTVRQSNLIVILILQFI